MRNILIGLALGIVSMTLLAQRGAEPFPDAVTADPDHYSISFENELVRLLRVSVRSGR